MNSSAPKRKKEASRVFSLSFTSKERKVRRKGDCELLRGRKRSRQKGGKKGALRKVSS